ncbi:GHMP family kinase ATP-binding protein [Nocardia tengchongensis]|uniref:GHMP family kinase ATP-binding protein n=1 Tax=Nocardia tengchongensis TaxID=2055889 RepID=UPI00369D1C09
MTRPSRVGVGSAFGSCGELLQGITAADNRDFLVTLPIRRGSVAVFEPCATQGDIQTVPPHKSKSRTLAGLMLDRSGGPRGGRLTIVSDLAEGKGLASSTADLVATARAIADSQGRAIAATEIEDLLRAIEPSDGVMYPGSVAFYHREVRLLTRLPALPPLTIVLADEGGQIDTVEFNRLDKPFTTADKREYTRLLTALAEALARRDHYGIGEVATRSALMNSALRERPHLDMARAAAHRMGALGVVIAHSGTTTGILIADEDPDYAAKVAEAQRISAEYATAVSLQRTWRPCPPDWPDPIARPRVSRRPRAVAR